MLFLHWTHLFEFQLVKHFLTTILSSLIYLRENTGNTTRSRPICTLFSQWINELTLWMSFQELITDTCPPSSHLTSLSHLYCCFQASTVVCDYLFLACRFPTRRETPPLCTSKSSEVRQVAFQRGTQQTLTEWVKAPFTELYFWSSRLFTSVWTGGISPHQGHMPGRIWISPHFAKPIFLRLATPPGFQDR